MSDDKSGIVLQDDYRPIDEKYGYRCEAVLYGSGVGFLQGQKEKLSFGYPDNDQVLTLDWEQVERFARWIQIVLELHKEG